MSIFAAHGGPPCSSPMPQALCALYIRPYSDNAYEWENVCEFTASSDALIADNVEMYDYEAGWWVSVILTIPSLLWPPPPDAPHLALPLMWLHVAQALEVSAE